MKITAEENKNNTALKNKSMIYLKFKLPTKIENSTNKSINKKVKQRKEKD